MMIFKNLGKEGWRHDLMVKLGPIMHKALASISNTHLQMRWKTKNGQDLGPLVFAKQHF